MTPHSPLPWRVGPYEGHASDATGRLVAACRGNQNNYDPDVHDMNDANARFIVRACNNHADLLAALKAIIAAHQKSDACSHGEEPDYCDACDFEYAKRLGRAVLASYAVVSKAEQP